MHFAYSNNYQERDPRRLLRSYLPWVKDTFELGDLFVTINLKGIRDISTFVKCKLSAIEQRVFLRRPNEFYRFPVLNFTQDWPHLHMLLKNVEYKSFWNCNFSSLVFETFRKGLKTKGAVNIKPIDNNVDAVVEYSLLKQGDDVTVLVDAMKMPPTQTDKHR